MEEGIADGLAVDGHGHGVTQVHVSEGALDHVAGEVVGGGLRAVQELVARGDGVAILGLAVLLGRCRKRSDGHVGDIEVTSLELLVGGLDVLLDHEVDTIENRGLAVVIVEAHDVDVLAVDPLAVHHEGAVADGRKAEVDLAHVLGSVRDGRERGVRGDIGEVSVSVGEGDHEGVIVRAGETRHLLGLASSQLVIAGDHGKVITDDRGALGVGGGVHDALPAILPVGSEDVGAVVELGLLEVEGELSGVVVRLPALARERLELAGLEVVLGKGVEQLEADLGALVLLQVVRLDADRVVDVVAQGAALGATSGCGTTGRGATLGATRERGERASSEGSAHEVTAVEHRLLLLEICHAFLLF